MTNPVFRAQDATQIRMAFEMDANQIIGFSFVPVCNSPDFADAWYDRKLTRNTVFPAVDYDLQFKTVLKRDAVQLVDHFDMWLVPKLLGFLRIGFQKIRSAQVVQVVKQQPLVVSHIPSHRQNGCGRNLNPWINGRMRRGANGIGTKLL